MVCSCSLQASLVGRRIGGARWPGTNKTIGGTIAFTLSTFVFSLLLAVLGLSEPFPVSRWPTMSEHSVLRPIELTESVRM